MSERKGEMQLSLCRPCCEDLKADKREVRLIRGGVDRKEKCAVCGRMRYAAVYSVSKAVKAP